jgi:hypothetical protein
MISFYAIIVFLVPAKGHIKSQDTATAAIAKYRIWL